MQSSAIVICRRDMIIFFLFYQEQKERKTSQKDGENEIHELDSKERDRQTDRQICIIFYFFIPYNTTTTILRSTVLRIIYRRDLI